METILEMENICKTFPGVRALEQVSFTLSKGEILGLVGENGAGKSTLMKTLSGAYTCESGIIKIDGKPVKNITPSHMIELGIAVIYQEMTLASHLTVAENIFLGRLPTTSFGLLDWKKMEGNSMNILKQLGLTLDPKEKICNLSVAKRQMVEIAKALSRNARVIVLDEPTAVLGENELQGMFDTVKKLSKTGISFIYISHRLQELFEIAKRVIIMKDGRIVLTDQIENLDTDRLVKGMVGRELKDVYPVRTCCPGKTALNVKGLCRKKVLYDINFTVCEGEIVGICGLAGSGRSEILRAIAGVDPIDSGEIEVFGKKVRPKSPKTAISLGIGILPEDRKLEGLLLKQSVGFNITISKLKEFTWGKIIRHTKERKKTAKYIESLKIRPNNPNTIISNLSGGNQQRVVFAKWLNAECKILLIDEPTRGIDVGAKQEIYCLIADLLKNKVSVVMVSSELPEILGLSDKILVMHEGHIVADLAPSSATEELIMGYATGIKNAEYAV
jgi:ribose transport system ATP-binding protein